MYSSHNILLNYLKVATIALILTHSALLMASECKGQVKNTCDTKESCSWINGYKKSNGAMVKSYCRKKSGKSDTTSSRSNKTIIKTDETNEKTAKATNEKK